MGEWGFGLGILGLVSMVRARLGQLLYRVCIREARIIEQR